MSNHAFNVGSTSKRLDEIQNSLDRINGERPSERLTQHAPTSQARGDLFSYDGRFFVVPKKFCFPAKIKSRGALKLWLLGQSASLDGLLYIKPLRKFVTSMLPTSKLRNIYKLHWKGFFCVLEYAEDFSIPENTKEMTDAEIEELRQQRYQNNSSNNT